MSQTVGIPVVDLKLAEDASMREVLLSQLREVLFNIGFLYITNHGVPGDVIDAFASKAPTLFQLPAQRKKELSKINSAQFLGFSDFAQEITQGKIDLREQFDIATEVPEVYRKDATQDDGGRDFSKLYWKLRGPNLWPTEDEVPGLKQAAHDYMEALSKLAYSFVHLVEEAFGIPIGTFDGFFENSRGPAAHGFLAPQHRVKLNFYPATAAGVGSQGVGPHKDSSGWLTFLHQVGDEGGLEVQGRDGGWIPVDPVAGTLVVNFGNAFEAATEGAVRATVHRVRAPTRRDRYSVPFFMALPLDLRLSDIRERIPERVRAMRRTELIDGRPVAVDTVLPTFLDPRWDNIGESVLRRFIRGYREPALKWYGPEVLRYYTE